MTRPHLLVVDDDRSNRTIVSELLTEQGYTVDVANDGMQALELVTQNPYALAVIDYQMPGMNGVELYRRIRELQPELIGVFLTAFTTLSTVYPAIEAGVERVLSKPVNRDELLPLVQEMVSKAR